MAGAVRPVARLDQGEADDLEAVRFPHQAQEGDVPAPLVPEVEVLADDDGLCAEAADENLRDHRPMAEVDAVVRADGDRTAADGPGTRLEVAHDLHEGRGYRAIARTPAVTTAATTITTANGARRHAGGAGGASGAPSARWT